RAPTRSLENPAAPWPGPASRPPSRRSRAVLRASASSRSRAPWARRPQAYPTRSRRPLAHALGDDEQRGGEVPPPVAPAVTARVLVVRVGDLQRLELAVEGAVVVQIVVVAPHVEVERHAAHAPGERVDRERRAARLEQAGGARLGAEHSALAHLL